MLVVAKEAAEAFPMQRGGGRGEANLHGGAEHAVHEGHLPVVHQVSAEGPTAQNARRSVAPFGEEEDLQRGVEVNGLRREGFAALKLGFQMS